MHANENGVRRHTKTGWGGTRKRGEKAHENAVGRKRQQIFVFPSFLHPFLPWLLPPARFSFVQSTNNVCRLSRTIPPFDLLFIPVFSDHPVAQTIPHNPRRRSKFIQPLFPCIRHRGTIDNRFSRRKNRAMPIPHAPDKSHTLVVFADTKRKGHSTSTGSLPKYFSRRRGSLLTNLSVRVWLVKTSLETGPQIGWNNFFSKHRGVEFSALFFVKLFLKQNLETNWQILNYSARLRENPALFWRRGAARREWMSLARGKGNVVFYIVYWYGDVWTKFWPLQKLKTSHGPSSRIFDFEKARLGATIENGSTKNLGSKFLDTLLNKWRSVCQVKTVSILNERAERPRLFVTAELSGLTHTGQFSRLASAIILSLQPLGEPLVWPISSDHGKVDYLSDSQSPRTWETVGLKEVLNAEEYFVGRRLCIWQNPCTECNWDGKQTRRRSGTEPGDAPSDRKREGREMGRRKEYRALFPWPTIPKLCAKIPRRNVVHWIQVTISSTRTCTAVQHLLVHRSTRTTSRCSVSTLSWIIIIRGQGLPLYSSATPESSIYRAEQHHGTQSRDRNRVHAARAPATGKSISLYSDTHKHVQPGPLQKHITAHAHTKSETQWCEKIYMRGKQNRSSPPPAALQYMKLCDDLYNCCCVSPGANPYSFGRKREREVWIDGENTKNKGEGEKGEEKGREKGKECVQCVDCIWG